MKIKTNYEPDEDLRKAAEYLRQVGYSVSPQDKVVHDMPDAYMGALVKNVLGAAYGPIAYHQLSLIDGLARTVLHEKDKAVRHKLAALLFGVSGDRTVRHKFYLALGRYRAWFRDADPRAEYKISSY